MRIFGYARVSTSKQSLDIQIKTLMEAGVESHRIFSDKTTGSNANRDGLGLLRLKMEKGDVLLVTQLDRLGRNTFDMLLLIEEFDKLGVTVRFLKDGISTDGPMGRMLITIISAIAQAERHRILERTSEGRIEAMSLGVKFGPKPHIDRQKVRELAEQGMKKALIAKELKISKPMVYYILKQPVEQVIEVIK